MRLHKSAIIVDTHEDVPERLEKEWVDIGVRSKTGHTDIPRWREGGMTAPFLAAYVSADYAKSGGSAKKALEFIDLIHRLVDAHPADLVFTDSVAGIREAKKNGKIAILIGIEGGHAIEDSLGALSSYYRLGVRYMTLTHTNTNNWADSAGSFWTVDFDPAKYVVHHGLTDFGKQVVLEMNRLGMLVDISHVSEDTIRDVLEVSKAPVFASHSSCRALSDIPRNLRDEQIKAIAAKGGVVMVNRELAVPRPEGRRRLPGREEGADAEDRGGSPSSTRTTRPSATPRSESSWKRSRCSRSSWTQAADHIERSHEDRRPARRRAGNRLRRDRRTPRRASRTSRSCRS